MHSSFKVLLTTILAASAVFAVCDHPDAAAPHCETSNGSPNVNDCQNALLQVGGNVCHQFNNVGSLCTTIVTVGTCKVDVCGFPGAELEPGVNCGGFLQNILNTCQSNGKVGGFIEPETCNVSFRDSPYKLQFSHS